MANTWKVGSRWSSWGNPNASIKEIFIQNNIFFVGGEKARKRVKQIKVGDRIALADGIKVIAVGVVESEAKSLSNYNIGEKVDHVKTEIKEDLVDGWPMAVRTRFYPLEHDDQFNYTYREFIRVVDLNYISKIENLVTKYSEDEFDIIPTTSNINEVLKYRYQVPVYQRPYSWSKVQIDKFIMDIFDRYWGYNRDALPEPMFIGTMQLSAKPKNGYIEIVDGQQRLTTLLLLLYVIRQKYEKDIPIDWLITKVNNGSQQALLNEVLNVNIDSLNEKTTNIYEQNTITIKYLIERYTEDESDSLFEQEFDIDGFIKFLFRKIIFVQIKIKAGLSKTLQVFDTINTTGLSLAGSDIFKLRMYEYLKEADGAFDRINEIYEKIERYNSGEVKETDINGILSLYQQVLISRYDLPNVLYDYNHNRFFDELFNNIFDIAQNNNFRKAKEVSLNIEDIKILIDVRFQWRQGYYVAEKLAQCHTAEDYCASHQIGWSRYSRYWILRFMFIHRFPNDADKLPSFMRQVSKYLFIYSIVFEKTVYHAHRTIRQLMKEMYKSDSTAEGVIDSISNEIQKDIPNRSSSRDSIINVLNNGIAYSAKKKNLVCRLSAMFDESNIESSSMDVIQPIIKKLYHDALDIEHVHSTEDNSLNFDEKLQNSIGNLVLLDFSTNRSLGKKPFSEKRPAYQNSIIGSVKKIANENLEWGEKEALIRKEKQIEQITQYLYES
ncbi:MAG TPA: DUF262 domain-containing HNH endonuclease family protein [Draconibacterium sp.]|nr:DUF262 domain-containing HNH endonuclease family protein [Draconibacterium sp.]